MKDASRGQNDAVEFRKMSVARKHDGGYIHPGEKIIEAAAFVSVFRPAFEAEERGDSVELLIQGYYGDMSRRVTGGTDED